MKLVLKKGIKYQCILILISINIVKMQPMMELQLKIPEVQTVFDEFICPITRAIMADPVLGHTGISFERSAIEQWIDKYGTDPITLKPLQKKDLVPNRPIREAIYKFVQGLTKKQKERLQYLKVYQVAKLREKELEDMAFSHKKEVQKLLRQIEVLKSQKELRQDCKLQIAQIKQINLVLQQMIKNYEKSFQAVKEQNIKLKNQKESAKIQCQKIQQEIKKNENQLLNKENFDLRQLQKRHCQEIQELQKRLKDCQCSKQQHNVKITPDKQSRGLKEKEWVIDNKNSNVCIVNKHTPNWLCSSPLSSDGEFVFTIKVIKLTNKAIYIGVMENEKKGEEMKDTNNYSVYLSPFSQRINRPNEKQMCNYGIKCLCSKQLPQCPFWIECYVNRQQNMIVWHYDGKQQANSMMPLAWKTNQKQLCAIVWAQQLGDSVKIM